MMALISFIAYLLFPVIMLAMGGFWQPLKWALGFTAINFIAGMGFLFGCLIAFFFEPASYWQSYNLPELNSLAYMDATTVDTFYRTLWYPYVVYGDFWRVVWDFSVNHGSLSLWFGEAVAGVCLFNIAALVIAYTII